MYANNGLNYRVVKGSSRYVFEKKNPLAIMKNVSYCYSVCSM